MKNPDNNRVEGEGEFNLPNRYSALLQPKHKFGAYRPWYWRFGHFVCSGDCKAEFPNHHLRNAHDALYHPMGDYLPVSNPTYREPIHLVFIPEENVPQRILTWMKLNILGWLMFWTKNVPNWYFSD